MWQKQMSKAIYTLNVDNYAPEIVALTRPLLERYAKKIDAELITITERKFPEWPPVYEKFQIYDLAQNGYDWNLYIDADALVHPDLPDLTSFLPKDIVLHHGSDFAPIRWRYDRFFRRDGRHIGSGNWFTMASDLCIELWKPLSDLTFEEAKQNIFPTLDELNTVIKPDHLIDDYTCSRNIAKYGLKFISFRKLMEQYGFQGGGPWLWHAYTMPIEQKVVEMQRVLAEWRV